ncbi:ATP-binding protein [Allorhizocola rhizosphaerae]|uniref:ATP-binding protein n=1 Tax=Allorhizocola rhizosphaerae TaxID=1872709 RepID=UPI0013C33004|nr:tetratricopeptide repeat protein [Allorhizocola rhizosphaerae]
MTYEVSAAPFAELLLRHRIAVGLGQAELARRAGLSERTLRDLERGATGRPRQHSVRALAEALKLSGAQLSAFLAAARMPSAAAATGALPEAMTRLFGRFTELRSLVELVMAGRHRLISVTGPGGVGKTRLSAALVDELSHRAWDVRTVDVSALDDPTLVLEAVAEAFGVGGTVRLGPIDRLAALLRGARTVLVLDGMERVVAAAPDLSVLVRRCTGLTVVVTSQRPLRVGGEHRFRLGPLPLPVAVELFAARAAEVTDGFTLDEGNRDAVAAICRRVDGLPLAIELAAARMRLLTPAELLERLDRPLTLLADGGPDLPARHRSLHATISSSLDVVTPAAGALFDLMGAFSGGVGLDDVESVAGDLGHDRGSLLEALAELIDIYLVRAAATAGETRYTLPDTVRDIARERLANGTAWDRAHRALAKHYLTRVADQGSERVLATRDAANVRSAIGWAVAHEPDLFAEAVVNGLVRYYEVAGRLTEGVAALSRVAERGQPKAWVYAGHLARLRADFTAARRLGSLALQGLAPTDHAGRCRTHLMLGSVATDLRELTTSRRELHAALVHARRAGDVRLVGRVLNNLGTLSMELGRLDDAERLLRAALEAKRRGDGGDIDRGRTLFNLAETAVDAGRFEVGLAYAEEAMQRLLAGGYCRLAAFAATTAALAHLHLGRVDAAGVASERATALLKEQEPDDRRTPTVIGLRRSVVCHAAGDRAHAVELLRDVVPAVLDSTQRDREEVASAVEMHAERMAARDPVAATRMLGTANRLRRDSIRAVTPAAEAVARRVGTACRERLGADAFDQHYRRGFALDWQGLAEMCAAIEAG